jgi:hypothetical protein
VTACACSDAHEQNSYAEFARCITGKRFVLNTAFKPQWAERVVNLKSPRRELNFILVAFVSTPDEADIALAKLKEAANTVGPAVPQRPKRVGLRLLEFTNPPDEAERDAIRSCL